MMQIKEISKDYNNRAGYKINLLKKISFEIGGSQIVSIIAPAGAGKSTLLKIISGLELPDGGEIINNGKIIFIPSEPSSFPWLNVTQNVLFAVEDEKSVDIKKIINTVGLEGYETHYPHNKSLGFRFRISLARSLAHKPLLICLDDPFNKMDETTKAEILQLVRKVNHEFGTAFLLASGNISEALFLSDVIYVMKKNPGEIFTKVNVELPRDRSLDIFNSEKFLQHRNNLEQIFKSNESNQLLNISI
ncbi:MAG: ABC transporter ATP-binding protein [Ignavibacteriales bacterium]|nr:ABC transporter ATP-binding protein [Ignavibacteriales bacterium]